MKTQTLLDMNPLTHLQNNPWYRRKNQLFILPTSRLFSENLTSVRELLLAGINPKYVVEASIAARNLVDNPRRNCVFNDYFDRALEIELTDFLEDRISYLSNVEQEKLMTHALRIGTDAHLIISRTFSPLDQINRELIVDEWLKDDIIVSFGLVF